MDMKKIFARYGLTVTQVAERMGTSQHNLSMAINGNPTYSKLCDIAHAVGCSPSELISDSDDYNHVIQLTCPHCNKNFSIEIKNLG